MMPGNFFLKKATWKRNMIRSDHQLIVFEICVRSGQLGLLVEVPIKASQQVSREARPRKRVRIAFN
jgi:hypothetical protein